MKKKPQLSAILGGVQNGFRIMIPAIVRYEGQSNKKFTHGKCYDAFFLEYWEGVRNSLHVRGDDGRVTDFNPFKNFTVISDEENLLNTYEAIVRCIDPDFDDELEMLFGHEYKAIGRDKDGLYLVMDETYCCYFYEPDCFEIVEDTHAILSRRSVYYSYNGGDEIRKY